eukprot:Tbor_TRINITY_DN3050_c0_g1::TRINITY_DN3050_c0_g1_i1::g.17350::m.17350
MGISSSNPSRSGNPQQRAITSNPVFQTAYNGVRNQNQQTLTIVRNPYPAQYRQGPPEQQHQHPLADPIHNRVREGENIKQLVTCDSKSVRYDPKLYTLSFKLSSNIPSFIYEVHTGVKETIRGGKVTFSPNRTKPPPMVYKVENELDATEMVLVFDEEVNKMHEMELVYNPMYPFHYPCVICCRWKDEKTGEEAAEYTYVNLGAPNVDLEDIHVQNKERTKKPGYVHKQLLSIGGSVYLVERLFGADQEDEHDDNLAVVIGVVDNGNSNESNGTAQTTANGTTDLIDDNDDDGLCVICISEPKNTCVLPCRHLCLCKGCAQELQKHTPKCPVCRMPFVTLLHKGK